MQTEQIQQTQDSLTLTSDATQNINNLVYQLPEPVQTIVKEEENKLTDYLVDRLKKFTSTRLLIALTGSGFMIDLALQYNNPNSSWGAAITTALSIVSYILSETILKYNQTKN